MPSLYKVYLDESGTHGNSKAVVVAGFVSNATEWRAFSEKWREVLVESGLGYFRMSEFGHRRGQFKGWDKDASEDLLNKLLRIIRDHTFWSIGCVVRRQSFDSILSKEAKQICGGAYGLAALACWRHLGLILQKMDAWMDRFMEAGARGRHAIRAIVDEDSKIPALARGTPNAVALI